VSKKYKAAAYLRLSYTDDRSAESDSISTQRKLIQDFLVLHPDIELVSEQIDDGYSGILFERPAVQKLFDLAQKWAVNCIIVKDCGNSRCKGRKKKRQYSNLPRFFALWRSFSV